MASIQFYRLIFEWSSARNMNLIINMKVEEQKIIVKIKLPQSKNI